MVGLLDRWTKKKMADRAQAGQPKAAEPKPSARPSAAPTAAKRVDAPLPEKGAKAKGIERDSIVYKVLLRPLVTEKAAIGESGRKYSFIVAKNADKKMIKKAIKDLYGVEPESVNVLNTGGRQVRYGRVKGRRPDYRKAVVTLPVGKAITLHEGV